MGVLLVLFAVKENTRDRTGAGFDLKEFNYQNCKKTQFAFNFQHHNFADIVYAQTATLNTN